MHRDALGFTLYLPQEMILTRMILKKKKRVTKEKIITLAFAYLLCRYKCAHYDEIFKFLFVKKGLLRMCSPQKKKTKNKKKTKKKTTNKTTKIPNNNKNQKKTKKQKKTKTKQKKKKKATKKPSPYRKFRML